MGSFLTLLATKLRNLHSFHAAMHLITFLREFYAPSAIVSFRMHPRTCVGVLLERLALEFRTNVHYKLRTSQIHESTRTPHGTYITEVTHAVSGRILFTWHMLPL